jgi:hypothetical protein
MIFLDFAKGQDSTDLGRGVPALVAGEDGVDSAARNFTTHKRGCGRVLVIGGKGGEVAAVPGGLRILQHGGDLIGLSEKKRSEGEQQESGT